MMSGVAQTAPERTSHTGPFVVWIVLVVVGAAFAVSIDVVRGGYGIKSDEATYMATALSAAYDGDLAFERRDLERFWGIYKQGPEGIFLKRGKVVRVHRTSTFPYVGIVKRPDARTDRLYFSKALIYPIFAAPFLRLLGLNGVLLFHVLLFAIVGLCAYLFLAARSSPAAACVFTTAFLGAAALPVYGAFLMPEIFNVALVFVAYFLAFYREVSPSRRLDGLAPQLAAAVLLGFATYSKPIPNGFLIAPLVVVAAWRRQWRASIATAATFSVATACWFAFNLAVTGEFNYQGGDRKTFVSSFPFDAPDATWDRRGVSMITSGSTAHEMLTSSQLPARFARNVKYFLLGRHFGFIPYSFPGVVAILLWITSPARRDPWRVATFAAFAGGVVTLLLIFPYTWSGGGGPPGNRYLVSAYPTLFFLVPPLEAVWPGVIAWMVGALFTVKMLVSPMTAAKFTYLTTEKGLARRLPVEMTMYQDLPIMLDITRARIPYRDDPRMLLYFLDQNAFPPEPEGMWVSGSGRSDILVRTVDPIEQLEVIAHSPIPTVLSVSLGGRVVSVPIAPKMPASFTVPADGLPGYDGYVYLMTVRSSEGFTPHLVDPNSPDWRNLGAQMQFRARVRQ